MNSVLQIHNQDNVLVTLRDIKENESFSIAGTAITATEDVPKGHKIALRPIDVNETILKYGYPIGHATKAIKRGGWVHTENLKTNLTGTLSYTYSKPAQMQPTPSSSLTFSGYLRKNGDVGIRNEIWILNTVGCINKVGEHLAKLGNTTLNGDSLDGVYHFPHPFGCSQLGDDLTYTQKILAQLANHPNAAGVLILGLGCENNYIESFKKAFPHLDEERLRFLAVQDVEDEMEQGLLLLEELAVYASQFKREPVPLSRLKVGLKCGGSDGFSGITANPLVGAFSDHLISHGGSTIMTEVPEMFGAETILLERASSEEIFHKTVSLVNDFKDYFMRYNQPVYENHPPETNKVALLPLKKNHAAFKKADFLPVTDVLDYGQSATRNGLNLVQGPGNDLVSVTALAAAGATIVLFTTGRGTPFGGPVPTLKLATNSTLYEKKKHWIDFNAGILMENTEMETARDSLFSLVLEIAEGTKQARNETYNFKEIAIFKDGVIL
ncbi:LOW QUALITY PROTEIN: altronate hydrolase [Bacillus sp. JCM 19046]|nr:LOW QUALITY PROTEIN: altronate hydrolase [Bacillus sp. JCM 19046]